jgi:N-acyl homoserine lactone hydrolase
MATAAEPRPAELPLAGGREGATVRLHPLLAGRALVPPAALLREGGRLAWARARGFRVAKDAFVPIPIPAFLLEHPAAGPVLIDAGLHPSVAVKPAESFGRVTLRAFRDIQMDAGQALPAQLRERDIDPAQVSVVVMTHLHVDHASGISEFPDATFVVSRTEWGAATSQGRFHGYVTRQFDHAFDYRLLDFDGAAVREGAGSARTGAISPSSFSGFARSFDLFGDGSVRAVYTPGHSRGHMSWSSGRTGARCSWPATPCTCAEHSTRHTSRTAWKTSICSGARCARSASTCARRPTPWSFPGATGRSGRSSTPSTERVG